MPQILIVDDDVNISYQIENILKNSDVSSQPLLEPKYILENLDHEIPDLILLDVNMPDMSGTSVLKMLKDHPEYQKIPVIMATSDTDKSLLEECFALGAIDFLYKPIDPQELLARLDSVFRIIDYQVSLEKEIKERKQLQAQLVQAAKLAALGKIGAGIAHELNTPLAIINLAVYELMDDFEDKEFDEFPALFQRIKKQVERSAKITHYLREFSGDILPEQKQIFSPSILVENLSLVFEKILQENEIQWEKNISNDLPDVKGSPILLQQVLMSLMDNSQYALKDIINKKITTRVFSKDAYVFIEIEDTGSGIPENIQQQIFDPFFTSKPVGSGYGLGLSASFGIIEDHLGQISLKHSSELSTCFEVRLPICLDNEL